MNKVVTIHLNGTAHQLEEAGYDALRAYLDSAAKQLAGNPDKDEIIADIEQSISDKFRSLTSPHRNVVLAKDVAAVLAAMGPVDDGSASRTESEAQRPKGDSARASAGDPSASVPPPPKRLYRIQEGAMLKGVCSGLGAYFGIDPTVIRIAWIVLSFITLGGMIAAYIVMTIVVPPARTEAERAAAQGSPSTAQEFINRARSGYYDAAKKFGDRAARREWKRRFRHEMRQWGDNLKHEVHGGPPWWHYKPAFTMAPAGTGFTIVLLTFISLALTLAWLFALLSLLLKGSVLGLTPPIGMPIWVGIVLLCILYKVIASPIRASRFALQQGGWSGGACCGAGGGLLETFGGLLLFALGLWLVDRYVPHAHEFFVQIPPVLEKATSDLREWWSHRA
jgi:phage shock protein PspC (stress-responsive transcriptional regulator)